MQVLQPGIYLTTARRTCCVQGGKRPRSWRSWLELLAAKTEGEVIMWQSKRHGAISDDADRMGRIAKPGGVEGSMDHAQGDGSRSSALSGAVATLNKQVARGSAAP